MATRAQKIGLGVFAAAAVIGAFAVVIAFALGPFWRARDTYRISFDDSVYGLELGALVYFNGVRVGTVDAMDVDRADPRRVVVTIDVDADTPVRRDTVATLKLAGITGLKIIDLRGGSLDGERLPDGATIPAGETTFDKLEATAVELADRSGELVDRAVAILDHADDVLTNLVAITEPSQFGDIGAVVAQAKRAADGLAATAEALRGVVVENRRAIRDSIASASAAADAARTLFDDRIAKLVADADAVVGELRRVVRGNQAQLRASMDDIRRASHGFKELARELRQRPSSLLRSSPPPDRRLP
jgi:phospholipid/cholesterol/gamma-HCH transport system substrate-binding protein